ncbi:MAG TPA: bifunctional diguanylate cyclase/phosphodiesterase [Pseudolabrys sp.]|nr:bifunctional diguanylate cyclase/phosphodiesterase [Pseudolabrys sp.]
MTRNEKPAGSLDTAKILRSIGDIAYEWRLRSDVIVWSDNAAARLGVAKLAEIANGRSYVQHVQAEAGQTRFDAVTKSRERDDGKGVPYQVQYAFAPAAGAEKLWIEDSGRWFAGPDGLPARAHGIVRIISERHERERRLAFLAEFDALTGEYNRARLLELLGEMLNSAVPLHSSFGFLLLAVDNLDRLNEGYGFDVADEVLAQVAKRIRTRLRGGDILGRHSGNKFGVILKNCSADELGVAAGRLLSAVREETIQTNAGPVAATATVGGVTAPRHARSVTEILSRAHEALKSARHKRPGSFEAYRPNVEREALRRDSARASDEIVAALNERRITLAFEPVVEARSRRVAFYEGLMRAQRADGRIFSNADIVPVAERLGLIRLLDHRVFELAIENLAASPDLHCSVNVSPESIVDPDWLVGFSALVGTYDGIAERLTIEITETAAIHNIDDTRSFVTRVKDLGCRIAIDDFGAGYTSFRNLRKLGVDIIKIDGAFVQNMTRSADDGAFVHTMIDLSRRLGLKTVAEWVQDEDTARALEALGCDYLQGALIGLALPQRPDELAKTA